MGFAGESVLEIMVGLLCPSRSSGRAYGELEETDAVEMDVEFNSSM